MGGGKLDGCWNIWTSFPLLLLLIILIDMWHWGMSHSLSCLWAAEESAPRNLSQRLSPGHRALWLILVPPLPSPAGIFPPATLDYWESFVSCLCDLVHSALSLESTLSFFTLVNSLFSFQTQFKCYHIWDIGDPVTLHLCQVALKSPSRCSQDTPSMCPLSASYRALHWPWACPRPPPPLSTTPSRAEVKDLVLALAHHRHSKHVR